MTAAIEKNKHINFYKFRVCVSKITTGKKNELHKKTALRRFRIFPSALGKIVFGVFNGALEPLSFPKQFFTKHKCVVGKLHLAQLYHPCIATENASHGKLFKISPFCFFANFAFSLIKHAGKLYSFRH